LQNIEELNMKYQVEYELNPVYTSAILIVINWKNRNSIEQQVIFNATKTDIIKDTNGVKGKIFNPFKLDNGAFYSPAHFGPIYSCPNSYEHFPDGYRHIHGAYH
jgi:hypothetical protein